VNVVFYCTNCWIEISPHVEKCPKCGAVQSDLNNEAFDKKLLRALNHPEPETVIRAATILGERRVGEAIPVLESFVTRGTDPFIRTAAIVALGKFNDPNARKFLHDISTKSMTIIERTALEKVLSSS
jgi:HEAT repeat protein